MFVIRERLYAHPVYQYTSSLRWKTHYAMELTGRPPYMMNTIHTMQYNTIQYNMQYYLPLRLVMLLPLYTGIWSTGRPRHTDGIHL